MKPIITPTASKKHGQLARRNDYGENLSIYHTSTHHRSHLDCEKLAVTCSSVVGANGKATNVCQHLRGQQLPGCPVASAAW